MPVEEEPRGARDERGTPRTVYLGKVGGALVAAKVLVVLAKRVTRWRKRRQRRQRRQKKNRRSAGPRDESIKHVSDHVENFWCTASPYAVRLAEDDGDEIWLEPVVCTPGAQDESGMVVAKKQPGSVAGMYTRGAAAAAGAATLTASCVAVSNNVILPSEWAPVWICISLIFSIFSAVRQLRGTAAPPRLLTSGSSVLRIEQPVGPAPGPDAASSHGTDGETPREPSESSSRQRVDGTARVQTESGSSTEDEAERIHFLRRLEGTYTRNNSKSDTLEGICNLMRLNWFVRRAVLLVRGIEIVYDPVLDEVKFDIFSVIPWFRITERYPLEGDPKKYRRRDMRSGTNEGSARIWRRYAGNEQHGEMVLELRLKWDDPRAGEESAVYSLVNKGGQAASMDGEACDLSVITYAHVRGTDGGRCMYRMHGDRVV